MKRILFGLGGLVLISCGSANVSGTVNANGNTVSAEIPDVIGGGSTCVVAFLADGGIACPDAATDPTTEIVKDGVVTTVKDPTTAFSIATAAELPICCPEKEGALVFIKDSASFKTCSSNQWGDIDLRGAAGVGGIAGTNGTNGVDGINGTNGSNGTNGTNGVDGLETRISFQQICDGTFGFSNTNNPSASSNLESSQILIPGYIHVEYSETTAGDKLFSGRIVSDGSGFDTSFNRIIPKNAIRNNDFWPAGGVGGLSLWQYAFSVDRIPVRGNSKFIFYPTRGSATVNASNLFMTYEIEDSSFVNNTSLYAGRVNPKVLLTSNMECTYYWKQ